MLQKRIGLNYSFAVGRVAQSVQRLATGQTGWGSNPGGSEIFRTCPDRPWGPPSLLYSGYRLFPGGKERPGRDADPSPPSALVKIVELYLYSPYGPYGLQRASVPVQGFTLPYLPFMTLKSIQTLSVQSRAAMRSVLRMRVKISQNDSDC